eukprot:SAG31_NODE_15120_length_769_cov_2.936636_1_plen_210_part_10
MQQLNRSRTDPCGAKSEDWFVGSTATQQATLHGGSFEVKISRKEDRDALIARIVALETRAVRRAELSELTISEIKERATMARIPLGIGETTVEPNVEPDVRTSNSRGLAWVTVPAAPSLPLKAELIELLLKAEATEDVSQDFESRQRLDQMWEDLVPAAAAKSRALSEGVDEDAIDTAMRGPKPASSVLDLVVQLKIQHSDANSADAGST